MITSKTIIGKHGTIIGRIEVRGDGSINVYDSHQCLAGRCADGKTYDHSGRIIAYDEIPGMLLDDDD
jgi:hypothetical protein